MINRKLQFFCIAVLSTIFASAQMTQRPVETCGTGAPSEQWENWFQKQIKEYQEKQAASKQIVNHVIPVIVHIIHFNQTVGTYPNIDSNQVKSQIVVLNNDFAGVGLNNGNLPTAFASTKANTGITFCLATKNPLDNPLPERGIDRVNAQANSWQNPNTPTLNLVNYFNTVIIPSTIWDPTKYLNIWISDRPASMTQNGFATYPAGTGLNGLFGGNIGTALNDGIWIYTRAFGTVGTVTPPYDKGRSATHELGHWLGLRHTWGDGNCLSDYVGDTPYTKQARYGCPTFSTMPLDECGVNTAPNGPMIMNFMDRTDDACMYLFTNGQNVRMQTTMSQSPFRNLLGTHNKCTVSPAPSTSSAVASFNLGPNQCLNAPFIPFNTSSGYPNPTFIWSTSPAAQISPNPQVPNPAITITNAGTYTITLVTTNSLSSSTASMVITAGGNCAVLSPCLDTLKMIKNVDTLTSYKAPYSSITGCGAGFIGYMTGTSCYKDKEFAQYYPPSSYTATPFPQVNSVIVLFDSIGTKASNPATQIYCKIYGGTGAQGPVGLIGQKGDSLGKITSSAKVLSIGYLGKPNTPPVTNTKIIPFKFDFATPLIINNNSGFFTAIQNPNNTPLDSINVFSNTRYNTAIDSSAWFLQFNNNWRTYKHNRGAKIQIAMIPQITCGPAVGIKEVMSVLNSNVTVMPNPNNGMFNLIFTLPKEQHLNLRIYNAFGQEIVANTLNNVMNNVINVDLSSQTNGIYFAEISNGEEKIVRKIVVNH